MKISPAFAQKVLLCAGLGIVLWVACVGVGLRILPRSSLPHSDDDPPSRRQPGVAACVGLGALLALGGIAVVVRIPWWLVVVPFVVTGSALAIRDLAGIGFRSAGRWTLIAGGLGFLTLGLVALLEAPVGLRFPLSICDDWRAYLPMARRLLDTYGLDEPWSTRRLQSLGGFDLLRALPVAVVGDIGVGVAETVIASVFLAGLFVANGARTRWARVLSIGLILAVPLVWVPRSNTTGVLMGSPLLVAVLAATAEMRLALRAGGGAAAVRWAIGGGLVAAALMSVRPDLGLFAAVLLVLGTLSATGTQVIDRIRVTLVAGGSTVLAVAPWSFDMWRTAGTPLYPLFTGNLNRQAMVIESPRDAGDLFGRAFDLVRAGPYFWVSLGALLFAVVFAKLLPDAPLVAIAAAATAGVTVAVALNTPFLPPTTFARYIEPMSAALAVFLVCETIRGAESGPRRDTVRRRSRLPALIAVTAAILLAGLVYADGRTYFDLGGRSGGAQLLSLAWRDKLRRPPGQDLTTAALRDSYRRAFRGLDPHRTITAVDRPYLIDYRRDDVPNLDAPGYMAPGGGKFPFFTGPGPKIARLRSAGFDTLVATRPIDDLCLNPIRLEKAARSRPFDRPRYSRFIDWAHDIDAIARRAPHAVRRIGDLLVIDLPRAQRALAASGRGA